MNQNIEFTSEEYEIQQEKLRVAKHEIQELQKENKELREKIEILEKARIHPDAEIKITIGGQQVLSFKPAL